MKKKIFRVLGYVVCGILLTLSILLVISASIFGSKKTVDIFGVNIYIVENDDIASTPSGGAVLVQKSTVADLDTGKLVLYLKTDNNDEPTLGYVQDITARDGVHYITVSHKNTTYEFAETKLVGRADYYSKFWGGLIRFIKTPLGVMLIAVIPCAVLILYDIIRTAAANLPEPEVIPKVKNAHEEQPHTDVKLSVDRDGKALYSGDRNRKPLPKDNSVLFNYSGKQKETAKPSPSRNDRPIIPLTDKKPQATPDTRTPSAPKPEVSDNTGRLFEIKIPSNIDDIDISKPETDTKRPPVSETEPKAASPDKTAEIPSIPPTSPKPKTNDAFFSQPSAGRQIAPQIGRQRRQTAVTDDEAPSARISKPEKSAGKRSTQILASKNFDDLLSDDDDTTSYSKGGGGNNAVDDILASIHNRKF